MPREMLESILLVKAFVSRKQMCCNEFQTTKSMLRFFTSGIHTMADDDEQLGDLPA